MDYPEITDGKLWHGTSLLRAARIIDENHLRQWVWDEFGPGVSCASEASSAEYFAVRSDAEDAARRAFHREHGPKADFHYDSGEAEEAYPFLRGVVIELDAELLARDFKLKKVSYSGDWDDEVEFRVMGKAGIADIRRYVTGITFSAANAEWWLGECGLEPDAVASVRSLMAYGEELAASRDASKEAGPRP